MNANKLMNDKLFKYFFCEENGFGKFKPIAIELVQKIDKLLTNLNKDHCIICGTLLGFVRHKDLIPWDDDLDFLVDEKIEEDLEYLIKENKDLVFLRKSRELIRICFKEKGIEINSDNQKWKSNILTPEGCYRWPFIDLFIYSKCPEYIEFFHKKWNIQEFFPLKKENFLGLEVNIPKNPNYFLENNYGKGYMTTLKSSNFSHKDEKRKRKIIITMDQYNARK